MIQEHHKDEELILAIQKGTHEAFNSLVKKHSGKFYSIAFRLTNNKEQAEDIVQDCFLKFWIKPSHFDLKKKIKFTTWFYKVISNASFDLKRKVAKLTELPEDLKYQGEDIETILDKEEFQIILWNFINNLPERQQLALNLCFYEGISNKEAAEIMEINIKALESLLMRAKDKLRKDFESIEKIKDYQHAK
jgi:RNA polymerase sigma-70 factor, ECF subfamily